MDCLGGNPSPGCKSLGSWLVSLKTCLVLPKPEIIESQFIKEALYLSHSNICYPSHLHCLHGLNVALAETWGHGRLRGLATVPTEVQWGTDYTSQMYMDWANGTKCPIRSYFWAWWRQYLTFFMQRDGNGNIGTVLWFCFYNEFYQETSTSHGESSEMLFSWLKGLHF